MNIYVGEATIEQPDLFGTVRETTYKVNPLIETRPGPIGLLDSGSTLLNFNIRVDSTHTVHTQWNYTLIYWLTDIGGSSQAILFGFRTIAMMVSYILFKNTIMNHIFHHGSKSFMQDIKIRGSMKAAPVNEKGLRKIKLGGTGARITDPRLLALNKNIAKDKIEPADVN